MDPFEITVGNYTISRTEDGRIVATRYGAEWADYTGHPVIPKMFDELERLTTPSGAAAKLRAQFDEIMAGTTDEELVAEFESSRSPSPEREKPPHDWENPDWEDDGVIHDWKNYVSEEVQGMWDTFTALQKQAIARQCDTLAGREDWD